VGVDRSKEPLPTRHIVILGAIVGLLYAVPMVARGDVAPGIVGGILAGILCFLVLRQISERQWQRIREWERRHPDRA
jgi:ammonia channel protein AmtB